MSMDIDEQKIDEGLYSRQLYVLGAEAMRRMAASNVLIVGMKGLGVEIAKNTVLAGVRSVSVYDPEPVQIQDLGTQFFLREADVGKPRAEVTVPRLAELNAYVPVKDLGGRPGMPLTVEVIKGFQVVVLTDVSLAQQLVINEWTHANGVHFIAADVRGLFGSVFCDFGPRFTCIDPSGAQPHSGMIVSVEKDEDGVVTCLDETRHGLEDGDFVTFAEIKGMTELNACEPRKVTVKGPYTFSIGDTRGFSDYISEGVFAQVKMPKIIDFKPLRESLSSPEFLITDFAKFDRPTTLHAGFQALSAFRDKRGRFPRPRNVEDAALLVTVAKEVHAAAGLEGELDVKVLEEFSFQAAGDLSPMVAVLGGYVAQEVLKACSAKFHPTVQHLYFDSLESLPATLPTETECAPSGSRYDGQVAVFGRPFQTKIADHRDFLVGSGAIGCEMLKNWSMMGLASGSGVIHVTDLDTIEKSNLNRQFLFRPKDLGKFKAEVAGAAVVEMNPDLTGKIETHQDAVGAETENVYDDVFFKSLDCVTNALDNVKARQYMDRRCVFFEKPLLESGTLGTLGNTQVVIPHLTESYSSSQDPPEKSLPMCTVKSFPNAIEHTIEWSRQHFDSLFVKPIQSVNQYLTEPSFKETTLKYSGQQTETVKQIRDYLVKYKPLTFEECIEWARLQFEEQFNNSIRQLLYSLPKDAVTSNGTPFWSGPKRAPEALVFDSSDTTHLEYVICAANLHAFNYGLRGSTDPQVFKKVVDSMVVPEFRPKTGIKIQISENDAPPENDTGEEDLSDLLASLPPPSSLAGYRLTPAEFEKDDDSNFHIDFITAASNLRAMNYSIAVADRLRTKQIAGKIIPAIATTTAVVSGLVCLELYKIIDGKRDIEAYKNGFVNLALPFFGFSEPIRAAKNKYNGKEWTLWDRFEFKNDPYLREIVDFFQNEKLDVTMVSSGVSMLWSNFSQPKKAQERLGMRMKHLVESVSKKPLQPGTKNILVEVMVTDAEGEDVEIPFVVVWL